VKLLYYNVSYFSDALFISQLFLNIVAYVRYSNASLALDWRTFLGALIFFILCGILIFQNHIWEEEDYSRNKKWYKWKASAISVNKGDLSRIYPTSKKKN
tara:strand:- start:922 stop:1221 length:300 start_codon:yes stop_codon:yes gene_type:complete